MSMFRTTASSLRHAAQNSSRRVFITPVAPSSRLSLIRSYASDTTGAAESAKMDDGEQNIFNKLKAKFPGKQLQVQDVSGGCGSFYAILVSSPAFKGLSTIKQHKLVNECLKEDIKGIHGLQLKTIPEE